MKNELNRSNKEPQSYTVQAPKRSERQSHREKLLPFRWVLHNVDHSQYFRLRMEQKHMVWNTPFWSLVFSTDSMCSWRAAAMAFDFLAPSEAHFGIFTSLNWHLRTIYGTYRIVFNRQIAPCCATFTPSVHESLAMPAHFRSNLKNESYRIDHTKPILRPKTVPTPH